MYSQQQVQTFSKIFIGAETRYGLLTYHNKETGEKSCTEVKNKKIPIQDLKNSFLIMSPYLFLLL